jgi:hypothetical protein
MRWEDLRERRLGKDLEGYGIVAYFLRYNPGIRLERLRKTSVLM